MSTVSATNKCTLLCHPYGRSLKLGILYIVYIVYQHVVFPFLERQYPCKKTNKQKKKTHVSFKEKKKGKKSWFSICDLSCAFTKHQRMTNLVKLT